MKRKINVLAIAVYIALSALIPAGCSNAENTVSDNPSENSVVEVEETIVETSYIPNESTKSVVSVLPSENQKKSESGSEEEHSEIISKPESSEFHSENDNTALPSTPTATSDTSEMHKEPSEKAMDASSASEEHSETEIQNSIPKTETSIAEQVSHISIEPEQPTSLPVAATSVSLDHSSLNMTVGDKVRLTATINPADTDDMRLIWEWSDDSVIRIDSTGTVSAIGAGKATITVKTSNGKTALCEVTVKAKEQPKKETSKPAESSKSDETSKEPELAPILKPYSEPYDLDAIIADLHSVGEKQYGIVWEESLWVKNRGQDYGSKYDDEWGYEIVDGHYKGNCQFYFPESTRDSDNAADFRSGCLYTFSNIERDMKQNGDSIAGTRFKIVVEDVSSKYSGTEYWVYVLYT